MIRHADGADVAKALRKKDESFYRLTAQLPAPDRLWQRSQCSQREGGTYLPSR